MALPIVPQDDALATIAVRDEQVECSIPVEVRSHDGCCRFCRERQGRKSTAKKFIDDQSQEIVSYARCWQRGQTLGAERLQKQLLAQFAATANVVGRDRGSD
jgi:hypothetical protein